jgi:glycine cleavage system aminomethyltransferase T
MARDRAGRVNRSFLGLKVLSGGPIPHGTKLTRDGQEAGVVTSSVESPRAGGLIALGYVHWKHADPGTELLAGGQPVRVTGYPPVPS